VKKRPTYDPQELTEAPGVAATSDKSIQKTQRELNLPEKGKRNRPPKKRKKGTQNPNSQKAKKKKQKNRNNKHNPPTNKTNLSTKGKRKTPKAGLLQLLNLAKVGGQQNTENGSRQESQTSPIKGRHSKGMDATIEEHLKKQASRQTTHISGGVNKNQSTYVPWGAMGDQRITSNGLTFSKCEDHREVNAAKRGSHIKDSAKKSGFGNPT